MFYDNVEAAYKVLEISSSATNEEIKKAYRKMAVRFHPDKVSHLGPEFQKSANEKFARVNEAYNKIKKERGMN
jgi:DnaJ like chaperone protein